jgi:hypothetical protein
MFVQAKGGEMSVKIVNNVGGNIQEGGHPWAADQFRLSKVDDKVQSAILEMLLHTILKRLSALDLKIPDRGEENRLSILAIRELELSYHRFLFKSGFDHFTRHTDGKQAESAQFLPIRFFVTDFSRSGDLTIIRIWEKRKKAS